MAHSLIFLKISLKTEKEHGMKWIPESENKRKLLYRENDGVNLRSKSGNGDEVINLNIQKAKYVL